VSADRDEPLLVDAMLGTLAGHLRMCGYDAAYALDRGVASDHRLLEIARREGRTLLTRDRDLAARAVPGVLIESRAVTGQLAELARAGFRLSLPEEPARCGRCNGRLERLDAPRPAYAPDEGPVWRCVDCGQAFWKGSHWDDVRDRLEGIDRGQ